MGVEPEYQAYDALYESFESPLMRQIRASTYDQDIGQHSWVTAEELRTNVRRLGLSQSSRLLDLGCGPGGPLSFVVGLVGCRGSGAELSAAAIAVARARAVSLGLEELLQWHEADLNAPLPFADDSFEAVMSLDVVLHLRDRERLLREVARVLVSGGRFVFTDAGVLTGAVSNEEIRLRSMNGFTQFVPPGFNEVLLERSGFRLSHCDDRTASLRAIAAGRLAARMAHRSALEPVEGPESFERQQHYLETVLGLAEGGGVSRMSYLAELRD